MLYTPIFGKYMARDRYSNILRFLHLSSDKSDDPLWKVRPVLRSLTEKFKSYFNPFQNLVIDESLMLFKGRIIFKQYIPSKRHRFGIKMYVLCDCETGYIVDLCIHTGSDTDGITKDPPLGLSGSVVDVLMKGYLGKGHILYTDNWYTSPLLARYLHDHNTGAVGTVRSNRTNIPNFEATKKR